MAWSTRNTDPAQHRRNIWRTAMYISRYGRVTPAESMNWPLRDIQMVIEELGEIIKLEGESRGEQ